LKPFKLKDRKRKRVSLSIFFVVVVTIQKKYVYALISRWCEQNLKEFENQEKKREREKLLFLLILCFTSNRLHNLNELSPSPIRVLK